MSSIAPSQDHEVLSTVRLMGRLAQMLLELRDEYEHRPRPDTLAQIDRRLGELVGLRAALGVSPPAETVERRLATTVAEPGAGQEAAMRYCPQCATPLEERVESGRPRPVCPACGFVWYRNPLPVAACLAEAAGGLYLIRRRQAPGQGRWGLPAGFVEHGETPAAAAARETREETGLLVSIGALLGVYPYVEQGGEHSGIVIAYRGLVVGGVPTAGDDAAEVRLFAPNALPGEIAFESHRLALHDWRLSMNLP